MRTGYQLSRSRFAGGRETGRQVRMENPSARARSGPNTNSSTSRLPFSTPVRRSGYTGWGVAKVKLSGGKEFVPTATSRRTLLATKPAPIGQSRRLLRRCADFQHHEDEIKSAMDDRGDGGAGVLPNQAEAQASQEHRGQRIPAVLIRMEGGEESVGE